MRSVDLNCPLNPMSPINHGKLAHWLNLPALQLADKDGGNWRDLTRNQKHLAVTGGTAGLLTKIGPSGRKGGYGCFNFTSLSAAYFDSPSLRRTEPFSVFAWFFHTGGRTVIGDYDTSGNSMSMEMYLDSGTLRVGFRAVSGGYYLANVATTIADSTWYHGGFVWDGANVIPYLNGKADGTPAAASGVVPTASGGRLRIGRPGEYSNGAYHWTGFIDDVVIYNRPLGAAQVGELFRRSSGGYKDDLFWLDGYRSVSLQSAPPSITSLDVITGTTAGNTLVTITGTGFTGTTGITFGGSAATSVSVTNDTTVTCRTPAHAVGAVDVVLTTGAGSDTEAGGFTYVAPSGGQSLGGGAGMGAAMGVRNPGLKS